MVFKLDYWIYFQSPLQEMTTRAYFDSIQGEILKEVERSNKNIFVAVAWLTDKVIFNSLCEKAKSGIDVELILLNDSINKEISNFNHQKLSKNGGKVFFINPTIEGNIMHNKFCVIDERIVITGSYNWSNKAKNNDENVVIARDDNELALNFIKQFGLIKNRILFEKSPSTREVTKEFRVLSSKYSKTKGEDGALFTLLRKGNKWGLCNVSTNEVNVTGFLNILQVVRANSHIKRMVYASSSSVYGDNTAIQNFEVNTGKPLSPYAVTKYVNELYAHVFAELYGVQIIGLRYFNVFGPRQNPHGSYAAVIPLFIEAVKNGTSVIIHGDGEQSRDFTFVENVVQANIRAFFIENKEALNQVFNIACGEKTSINKLLEKICNLTGKSVLPIYIKNRPGNIRNSLADISKAVRLLEYRPAIKIDEGLTTTVI